MDRQGLAYQLADREHILNRSLIDKTIGSQ